MLDPLKSDNDTQTNPTTCRPPDSNENPEIGEMENDNAFILQCIRNARSDATTQNNNASKDIISASLSKRRKTSHIFNISNNNH